MKNKSLFSRFLTNKKVLFIVSVVFAFIFWVLTSDNITKTFTEVQVKYDIPESFSQEFEVFSASDESVSVTVDGKRVVVDALSSENFTATLDLSDVNEAGEKSFKVNVKCSENLSLDISRIEPANISLMIDRPMTKTVELKSDFSYSPAGYYVENNVPESVEISGPESFVKQVKCAFIGGNVNSRDSSTVTNNYAISLYDNEDPHNPDAKVIDNEYIKLSYTNVDVTFKYLLLKDNVPFSIHTDEGLVLNDKYYSVTPSSLNVAIPESALDENDEFLSLPIDIGRISQYRNESYIVTVDVADILGSDIINKSDGIEKVRYRLDFTSFETKTIEVASSNCIINNMPTGYKCNVPDNFSLVVIGTESAIDKLDAEKVEIILDFGSVKPSSDKYVDVPVTINLNVDEFCWAYRNSNTYSVLLNAE